MLGGLVAFAVGVQVRRDAAIGLVVLGVVFVALERRWPLRPQRVLRPGFATDCVHFVADEVMSAALVVVSLAVVVPFVRRPNVAGDAPAEVGLFDLDFEAAGMMAASVSSTGVVVDVGRRGDPGDRDAGEFGGDRPLPAQLAATRSPGHRRSRRDRPVARSRRARPARRGGAATWSHRHRRASCPAPRPVGTNRPSARPVLRRFVRAERATGLRRVSRTVVLATLRRFDGADRHQLLESVGEPRPIGALSDPT